ncbi:hypothetical protein ACFL0Q_03965 [Thermodesulfobacteriota bacterium]
MGFTIRGTVQTEGDRRGIAGLTVEAYDADLFRDDLLGSAQTDDQGVFAIACSELKPMEELPDVYLKIKNAQAYVLHSTRNRIMKDVRDDITINITLGPAVLAKTGLESEDQTDRSRTDPGQDINLKTWTISADSDLDNPPLAKVYSDLENHGSILALFRNYKETLDRSADNDDPVYGKLGALFNVGRTPEILQGHFYGITLGVRMGGMPDTMADFGNVLGMIWGGALSDESPWVGKSLTAMPPSQLSELTGRPSDGTQTALLGINHFNRIHTRVLNPMAFQFLNSWMDLHPAPEAEQRTYNWEKNGAYFIGNPAQSVCEDSSRPVFQLNYRYKALGNRVPNCWLIDEMVEISPGLFLGQLCYATRKLLHDYDDRRPARDYRYRNFGYFLLVDHRWHPEARRLFPYLEIPPSAPSMLQPSIVGTPDSARFSTFTLQAPPPSLGDNAVLAQLRTQAKQYPTLLHYLKTCAQSLQDDLSNESPYFAQLAELFTRGISPEAMNGFYYGALVSWRSAALFNLFGINSINMLYTSVAAPFSTWTGKRFEPITSERLQELTDGHETGRTPTAWGANTQALRTLKERFVGRMMKLADIWTEAATTQEAQQYGYDVKNFFFIARQAQSISAQCPGKTVYQFNYRWPKLKTIIPDCFCIDEVVQIAQGLFLGRLMYATNIVEPYDPHKSSEIYNYDLFGYFLLMDQQWQQIRLSIGYDLHNV